MNSIPFCPDCNSQDVQKIDKNVTITTEKSGCSRIVIGFLFWPLLFLMKKKSSIDMQTYTYYACRSCGREFGSN